MSPVSPIQPSRRERTQLRPHGGTQTGTENAPSLSSPSSIPRPPPAAHCAIEGDPSPSRRPPQQRGAQLRPLQLRDAGGGANKATSRVPSVQRSPPAAATRPGRRDPKRCPGAGARPSPRRRPPPRARAHPAGGRAPPDAPSPDAAGPKLGRRAAGRGSRAPWPGPGPRVARRAAAGDAQPSPAWAMPAGRPLSRAPRRAGAAAEAPPRTLHAAYLTMSSSRRRGADFVCSPHPASRAAPRA